MEQPNEVLEIQIKNVRLRSENEKLKERIQTLSVGNHYQMLLDAVEELDALKEAHHELAVREETARNENERLVERVYEIQSQVAHLVFLKDEVDAIVARLYD